MPRSFHRFPLGFHTEIMFDYPGETTGKHNNGLFVPQWKRGTTSGLFTLSHLTFMDN